MIGLGLQIKSTKRGVQSPSLGVERIVNGDFSAASGGWDLSYGGEISGGVGIAHGKGALNSTGANHSIFQRIFSVGVTKSYRVTFDAKIVSGSANLQVARGFGIMFDQQVTATMQTYTYDITDYSPSSGWQEGIAFGGLSGVFHIDNVSVKEIL